MSLHKEIHLETEICEHLAANGWLYSQGDATNYDRTRALFPADVIAWVQTDDPAEGMGHAGKEPRRTSGGYVVRAAARFHKPTRDFGRAAPRH